MKGNSAGVSTAAPSPQAPIPQGGTAVPAVKDTRVETSSLTNHASRPRGRDYHAPLSSCLSHHQSTRARDSFNSSLATMCNTLAASVW